MDSQPIKCQNCGTYNLPNARICSQCGKNLVTKLSPNIRNGLIAIAILIFVSCICCSFFTNKGKEEKINEAVSTPTKFVSNLSSPTATTLPASPTPTTFVSSAKTKTATVIAENANLRATANNAAEVVKTISSGDSVSVIKQKGAWFYVSVGESKGWLHGNTIRLEDSSQESANAPSTSNYSTKNYTTPKSYSAPEPMESHSGASAKCSDGTLSYSAHRRGTCSHHGGVAVWY